MTIHSRIAKIEAALAAKPTGAVLFREPPTDADDSARESFDAKVCKAIESGCGVIVVRNGQDSLRRSGVTYVPNDFEGQLALAAATPDAIHGDRLRAILARCMNTPMPIVKEAKDGEV